MKKPWLAFLLNFLFAGAGLAYLGNWGWAVLNFITVIALGFVLVAVAPDSLGPASAGLAAASGGLAMAVAQSMNAKTSSRVIGQQAYPTVQQPRASFVPPQPGASDPAFAAGARARSCEVCGALVGSSKFCAHCGSQLQPANQCAGCGAAFQPPAKFCPDCGRKVG